MLDVHVLMLDSVSEEYHRQCRESLDVAVAKAGFPVHVHYVPGILGHLGIARWRGYTQGSAPYVTHVDDDDYVDPQAFAKLRPFLEKGAAAVSTGEALVSDGRVLSRMPHSRHHLMVYSRDVLWRYPFYHLAYHPDQLLTHYIESVHIPEVLYYRRYVDKSPCALEIRKDPQAAARDHQLIKLFKTNPLALPHLSDQQIRQWFAKWLEEPNSHSTIEKGTHHV